MLPTLREQGYRTTGETAKAIGVDLWRLLRALKTKQVQEPARVGQLRCWTAADVERARIALAHNGRSGES